MADKRPEELIDYWPKDVGLDDFRQGYLVGKHDGFKEGYEEGMISGFNGVIGRENLMLRGHADHNDCPAECFCLRCVTVRTIRATS